MWERLEQSQLKLRKLFAACMDPPVTKRALSVARQLWQLEKLDEAAELLARAAQRVQVPLG
jgi:hypothetical protein